MPGQPLITCENITVRFGDEVVLDDFSFSAPKGKHTVLKGESGSGKSTLLKLLLGFLKPSDGEIRFENGLTTKEIRQHTAWLPQDLNLGGGIVADVIQKPFEFAANRSKLPNREKIVSVLTVLGLSGEDIAKQFRDLSTGQRQRVGLAICHLLDKPVILLDEPTSALDNASKEKASSLLLAHTNKTVISTSHDPYWVEKADNVIELS